MNKKQKKAAPSEEDDSGVEVYYREGEEEIEETSVLPKVRDSFDWGRKGCSGEGALDCCLKAELSRAPSSFFTSPVR